MQLIKLAISKTQMLAHSKRDERMNNG